MLPGAPELISVVVFRFLDNRPIDLSHELFDGEVEQKSNEIDFVFKLLFFGFGSGK